MATAHENVTMQRAPTVRFRQSGVRVRIVMCVLPWPVPTLTLAHSPDPDDAFMWWPITGMVSPDGSPLPGEVGHPAIDTAGFTFTAVPADISVLNRRAVERGDLDITAVSMRTYVDVKSRYMLTSCGASFGDGYGPKVVCRADSPLRGPCDLLDPSRRIAIPGRGTTAFLTLGLLLRGERVAEATSSGADLSGDDRFIEMPFDRVMTAVARGEADAGIVIHDAQLTFEREGLRLIADLGAWWKSQRGLPLPLGANVIRRDLDARHGRGTISRVCAVLEASIRHALAHRDRALAYAATFAEPGHAASVADIDRFVGMYVNGYTLDLGDTGYQAVVTLLHEGALVGLCPEPEVIDIARPSTLR